MPDPTPTLYNQTQPDAEAMQDPQGKQPMPKRAPQPQQPPGLGEDQVYAMLQQASEQIKFELKKEISTALNAKANSLREIDPTTATALQGCAIAIAEAMSSVTPIGQNEEFNAGNESPVKQADNLDDLLYKTIMGALAEDDWLEVNKDVPQEKLAEDINETFLLFKEALDKYTDDYDIDFEDPENWDFLQELILDGTLMSYVE